MHVSAKMQLIPIVSMAIGSTAVNAADIAGKWESDRGPVTITRKSRRHVLVAFAQVEGRVDGVLDGDIFQGTWVRKHRLSADSRREKEVLAGVASE